MQYKDIKNDIGQIFYSFGDNPKSGRPAKFMVTRYGAVYLETPNIMFKTGEIYTFSDESEFWWYVFS